MAPRLTYNGAPLVPIGPIQAILEEEIARRWSPATSPSPKHPPPMSGLEQVASDIALHSGKTHSSIQRRLYTIRKGVENAKSGEVREKAGLSFQWADLILCALGREFEWYTNPVLSEFYQRLGAEDEAA